ncbi:MAG: hypothetical protein JWN43_3424 [Gammaproteobacteria bacterium]|nr:hypothetical protein [Gammaproteobacteria bacterium]
MALKIDTNMSATAFHVNDGATVFPYAIDAQHAISNHPLEWSAMPWSRADADAARKTLAARYESDVADAKARNLPLPAPPPPDPAPLTPEDQAALDEHNKAVAEAAERLADYRKRKEEERVIEAQVAADEALVASLPPAPDPTIRRPMTPAQIRKNAAMTDDEKAAKKAADDKATEDKIARNTVI